MAQNRIHNYIERIRNSNERVKRRFVATASMIAMLIVVLLWVVYLNLTLPTLAIPKDTSIVVQDNATNEVAPPTENNSFFGVIERGATVIGKNIVQQFTTIKDNAMYEFSKIGALTTKKNETVVTPNVVQFEPNTSLEPIPSTKLPE